ncbi:MAG: DUF222 domain-containing protein, partial [Candidatus Nanopelagicales bacterium]
MFATAHDTDEWLDLGPVTDEERAFIEELWARDRALAEADDADFGAVWAEAFEWGSDGQRAESMLSRPADVLDALVLAELDLAAPPSKELGLRLSRRIDEVTAMLAAMQARVTAALAGPEPSGTHLDEVHVETEVALARTISPTSAGLEIETARALATTFPQFLAALSRGEVSPAHCRRLVEATRLTTDADALARIGDAALPKARTRTVPLFGRALRRLIAKHDPDASRRRAERLRTSRNVTAQRLDDGMGRLVYEDEWWKVNAVLRRIRAAGRATQLARRQAGADGPAGQADDAGSCRADALLALMLGTEQADGTVVLDPAGIVQVECQVVIDLATLRGEADRIALLDGEPVPADVGRAWARGARWFRRMVTDPVTGHLKDHGRRYRAEDVRDFIFFRDGGCRVPVCGISHRDRLQADHAVPAPEGPTSAANLGALSTTHHQLKTAGYFDLVDSKADGSAVMTTLWGQRILIPPRPFL